MDRHESENAQDLPGGDQEKMTREEFLKKLAILGVGTSAVGAVVFGALKYNKWKLRQPFPHSSGEATPEHPEHMETEKKRKMTERQYRDFVTLTEGGTNRLNEIFQGTLIAKSDPDYMQDVVGKFNGDPREAPVVFIEIFLTNKDSIPCATCTCEIRGGKWTIYYPEISASDEDVSSGRQEFTNSEQCESLEKAGQRLRDIFRNGKSAKY